MKKFVFVISLFLSFNLYADPKGREIMEKVYNKEVPDTSFVKFKMTLIDKNGDTRVREIASYTKKKNNIRKTLIKFLLPNDVKGTGFLNIENPNGNDDQFLYIPAIKKTRRIVGSQKNSSFMGSDFTYSDLENKNVDDAEHNLIKEEKSGDKEYYVVESIPVKESEYSKIVQWIQKDISFPVKGEFYDKNGKLIKRMTAEDLKIIDNYWTAMKTVLESVQKAHRTILEITEMKNNIDIPDTYFTERYLEK